MEYELQQDEQKLVVTLIGRLDAQSAPELEEAMEKSLDGITDVVFDMTDLDYISSAGLRILLAAYKLMEKRGGSMKLTNVSEEVVAILKMSGFIAIFEIE